MLQETSEEVGISLQEYQDAPPERKELIIQRVDSKVVAEEDNDIAEDYYKARDNMSKLLEIVMNATNTAAQIAAQTEHPKAFDSLNSLVGTARQVAMDVLNLQRKLVEIRSGGIGAGGNPFAPGGPGPFQGSMTTASIMELMRKEAGALQSVKSGVTPQFTPKPIGDLETVPVKRHG